MRRTNANLMDCCCCRYRAKWQVTVVAYCQCFGKMLPRSFHVFFCCASLSVHIRTHSKDGKFSVSTLLLSLSQTYVYTHTRDFFFAFIYYYYYYLSVVIFFGPHSIFLFTWIIACVRSYAFIFRFNIDKKIGWYHPR